MPHHADDFLARLPIFETQVRDAREFPNIVRDEYRMVGAGRSSDQHVIRSDRCSRAIELLPQEAILLGAAIVEGKGRDRVEESLQQPQVLSNPAAFPRTVEKLGLHDRREPQLRTGNEPQPLGQRG